LLLKTTLGLDFDDAYQYEIAKEYNFIIVTMDLHFDKVKKEIKIIW
jgi:predicted nucleic acid-binding protein